MINRGNERGRISCAVSFGRNSARKMLVYIWMVLLIHSEIVVGDEDPNCPSICTCPLEHLTETAIYRFIQKNNEIDETNVESNDVFYNNFVSELLEDKSIVRSAICILQTETDPGELIEKLPNNVEVLTIIQGYDTGNKSIKFDSLTKFERLLSLELLGPNMMNKLTDSRLFCEIDTPLPTVKYMNLENILIKHVRTRDTFKEADDEILTFEYVQKSDNQMHPLTIVQKGPETKVLPYEKYKEQDNSDRMPLFIGFGNLILLRIKGCELNNVHWTMFEGLSKMQYLFLEKNNIRFIPPFAFYGTPNLKTLSLSHNSLLDIEIMDLAGLLELEYLDLSHNNFSQLSELSLPPFPKLKLANFGNNPITVIYPNTFEVMNTTNSLIIGNDNGYLTLMSNSFVGMNLLQTLTIRNLNIDKLRKDFFQGMPNLKELIITGNISEIEYDTFLEIYNIRKLILNNCRIRNVSMDAFIGLEKLEYLDLSKNELELLPPGVFDQLISLQELYLNDNRFQLLPRDIFSKIHPKLIRLNGNPWHCSCEMSEWKPLIVNKLKQKVIRQCEMTGDKMVLCSNEDRFIHRYVFDNKIAPKCAAPKKYLNWNVFQVMRRLLKCPEYKARFKKRYRKRIYTTNGTNHTKFEILKRKLIKHGQDVDNELKTVVTEKIDINKYPYFQEQTNYKQKFPDMDNTIPLI